MKEDQYLSVPKSSAVNGVCLVRAQRVPWMKYSKYIVYKRIRKSKVDYGADIEAQQWCTVDILQSEATQGRFCGDDKTPWTSL